MAISLKAIYYAFAQKQLRIIQTKCKSQNIVGKCKRKIRKED